VRMLGGGVFRCHVFTISRRPRSGMSIHSGRWAIS
jgi:hypothetical protein